MPEYNYRGFIVILDKEDLYLLYKYKWNVQVSVHTTYLKYKGIDIADYIMHPVGKIVDHKNRNGLDNRKENLLVCTQSLNIQKSPVKSKRKFRGVYYRGIYWNNKKKCMLPKYIAFIYHNKKYIYLGCFEVEEDGAAAYNKKIYELYGKEAYFNKVYCTELWL